MRTMPFWVATPESVEFSEPQLQLGEATHAAGDPVSTWDYLSTAVIRTAATINEESLLNSTKLTSIGHLSVTLQVDCPATGFRQVNQVPLTRGKDTYPMELVVEPHTVASTLEVRLGVVLNQTIAPAGLAAHRKGSRVYTDPRVYRFLVEGTGSGFPTEAFDFERAGYPPGAAWRLNIKAESLDLPFNAAVRLLINTGHPQATRLLSGKPGVIQSVLFHGVLEHMLLAVADSTSPDETTGFEEGSLGAVLEELTTVYLGMTLGATLGALAMDRSRLLAKLQEAAEFLRSDAL